MQDNKSARKRHRQNIKHRVENKAYKSQVKTAKRKFLGAIEEKNKENAGMFFIELERIIDKAAQKGVFHKNTAARKKSRMQKLLNTIS